MEVPAENLVGEEGKGFRYILDGMNAERILIAAEMHRRCQAGSSTRPAAYAKERVVFGRPIGQNQGVQFPIATRLRADARRRADGAGRRCASSRPAQPCGAEANMAKMLAAEAAWAAAEACMQTHGGFGFAEEYDIERKFRETRLLPGGADLAPT
jgi:alkylation response protein AidB-like acyl-CoA dehydrogenase